MIATVSSLCRYSTFLPTNPRDVVYKEIEIAATTERHHNHVAAGEPHNNNKIAAAERDHRCRDDSLIKGPSSSKCHSIFPQSLGEGRKLPCSSIDRLAILTEPKALPLDLIAVANGIPPSRRHSANNDASAQSLMACPGAAFLWETRVS